MAIPGIPRTEKVWLKRTMLDGSVYYITTKELDTSWHYLYKMDGDTAKKLGKARTPNELEDKYIDNPKGGKKK